MPDQRLLGTKQAAHILGVTPATVTRLYREKKLRGVEKFGSRTSPLRIPMREVKRLAKLKIT